jgi:hypothetical protein
VHGHAAYQHGACGSVEDVAADRHGDAIRRGCVGTVCLGRMRDLPWIPYTAQRVYAAREDLPPMCGGLASGGSGIS